MEVGSESERSRVTESADTDRWRKLRLAGLVLTVPLLLGVLQACGGEQVTAPTAAPAEATEATTDEEAADEATVEATEEEADSAALASPAASPEEAAAASPIAEIASPVAATPVEDVPAPPLADTTAEATPEDEDEAGASPASSPES